MNTENNERKYVPAFLEVIRVDIEDIITASNGTTINDEPGIDLPIDSF